MEILNRFNGAVIFSLELPEAIAALAYSGRLGWLILRAIKGRADLSDANLSRADLSRADLSRADLSRADLSRADLSRADLSRANLSRADLSHANLSRANLSHANLSRADLSHANLSRANLSRANLSRANLSHANLSDAKSDVFMILLHAIAEAPALLNALTKGAVNGSLYEGSCACLVGTIANARGADYRCMPGIEANSSRPAERFFMGIKTGDTPETNQVSKIAAEWVAEFIELTKPASVIAGIKAS